MVFRFEMYKKFAYRWDGFGRNLIFEKDKKFPWGPPLRNFQNFEAAFPSIRLTPDAETLLANSRDRGRESAVGFKRIRKEKDFSTLLYGIFFLAKSDMFFGNSLLPIRAQLLKKVFRFEMNRKYAFRLEIVRASCKVKE